MIIKFNANKLGGNLFFLSVDLNFETTAIYIDVAISIAIRKMIPTVLDFIASIKIPSKILVGGVGPMIFIKPLRRS